MNKENPSLKEIFEMLRNGDKKGVELLFSLYYNKMFGVAYSILKNRQKSEDVVSSVFCKLLALNKDSFPSKGESSWLYTVVKNEALSYTRADKPTSPLDDATDVKMPTNSIDDFVDMDNFYSLVSKLDSKREKIVTLKILGGYTHKEIAEMLNMKIGTVQWLYATSITKLKVIVSSLMAIIFTLLPFGLLELAVVNMPKKGADSSTITSSDGRWIFVITVACVIVACIGLLIFVCTKNFKTPTKYRSKTSK